MRIRSFREWGAALFIYIIVIYRIFLQCHKNVTEGWYKITVFSGSHLLSTGGSIIRPE